MENEQLRTSRRGSGDDEECKRSLAAEVNSRQSSRRSAFGNGADTTVAGEDMGCDGAGAGSVGPASCRSNRIGGRERGCGHRVSTEVCLGIWCCEDATKLEMIFNCNIPGVHSTLLVKFEEGCAGRGGPGYTFFLIQASEISLSVNATCSRIRAC